MRKPTEPRAWELEEVMEAWYPDATKVFDETTPEGQMIRGTILTTFTRPEPPPAQSENQAANS